nr:hypothetical protein [uncultured Lachnoclostridium sp.]
MAVYEALLELVKDYFVFLGYEENYVSEYFSSCNFREIISIRLANANVANRNKKDKSSHQSHIAITGEAIYFFYTEEEFAQLDNKSTLKKEICISSANLKNLMLEHFHIKNKCDIQHINGVVSVGKRTQNQLQLSKKNSENSECFNMLRLGLFENDILMLLKFRHCDKIFAIGIPDLFYLDYIPSYAALYETNTYLSLLEK